jgi:hypothetical protein
MRTTLGLASFLSLPLFLSSCTSSAWAPPPLEKESEGTAKPRRYLFDAEFDLRGLPEAWQPVESGTSGMRAAWGQARGRSSDGALAVLRGRGFGAALHGLLSPEDAGDHGASEVWLRLLGGESTRGGGVLFWQEPQSHLYAVYDARDRQLRIGRRDEGRVVILSSGLVREETPGWRKLSVRWEHGEISARMGATVVRARMPTAAFRLGLCVLGDAETAFDDFVVWH